MSSPRTITATMLIAAVLGLLPRCGLALDAPRPAQSADAGHASPPALRTNEFTDPACTACVLTMASLLGATLELALPRPPARPPLIEHDAIAFSTDASSRGALALRALQFRDNEPLVNRLKRVQAWPLLTIWDSTSSTLYLGVNRDGEPGVHLRQKRQDRGALLPRRRFVLIANPAAPDEPTAPRTPAPSR